MAFTKLAIIFLYLRLFVQWNLKRFAQILAAIIFAGSTAFALASVFECNPIHKVWDRRQPGTCFDLGASWYAYAAFNAICDLIIIIMPMPAIWRLQLKLTQKLSLAAVFLLGWFVVFTSIMRLVSLPASAKSKEPTCMHTPPARKYDLPMTPANHRQMKLVPSMPPSGPKSKAAPASSAPVSPPSAPRP